MISYLTWQKRTGPLGVDLIWKCHDGSSGNDTPVEQMCLWAGHTNRAQHGHQNNKRRPRTLASDTKKLILEHTCPSILWRDEGMMSYLPETPLRVKF
mmetsp:Transcript_240/g.549  ORF Transcript_240/g.549 Transcript_240/m.549 type:complete len:97 (+) Transcript_240:1542-1832(+)